MLKITVKVDLLAGMLGCMLMATGDWLMLCGDATATGGLSWLTEGAAQIPACLAEKKYPPAISMK